MRALRHQTGTDARGLRLVSFAHLVLTVPHERAEPLEAAWNRLEVARGSFLAGKWLRSHADAYRRRVHVTWSEAGGWHPHEHFILGWASFPKMSRKAAVASARWEQRTDAVGIAAGPLFYAQRSLPALRGYVFGDHFMRRWRNECEEGHQIGHLAALASTGDLEHLGRWEELETAAFARQWTGSGGAWFGQRTDAQQ